MARIVYAWELGGGWGHLSVAAPILTQLASAGHEVVTLLRMLHGAEIFFGEANIRYLPIPRDARPAEKPIRPQRTFAHLLSNTAFVSETRMLPIAKSWRWILNDLRPDLLLLDHAPSALMATRDFDCRRVTIGTGFTLPPAVATMPDWRPWLGDDDGQLQQQENEVLSRVNRTLDSLAMAPIDALSDLYTSVDETLLTTYAELDHFGQREGVEYLGVSPVIQGNRPNWPETQGPRIFAYLKPTAELPLVLQSLRESSAASLIHVPGFSSEQIAKWESPRLRIVAQPVDMSYAVDNCDFAILNGNHTSTVQMLCAGKPVLTIPSYLEQQLTGMRLQQLQAGMVALGGTRQVIAEAVKAMIENYHSLTGCQSFASRYEQLSAEDFSQRVIERLSP